MSLWCVHVLIYDLIRCWYELRYSLHDAVMMMGPGGGEGRFVCVCLLVTCICVWGDGDRGQQEPGHMSGRHNVKSRGMHRLSYFALSFTHSYLPEGRTGISDVFPPVWNLQTVIWFHFTISSLFLLPTPFALSDFSLSFFLPTGPFSRLFFFPEKSSIISSKK